MNPSLSDTSMRLGRYVNKHEPFEIFSLANQNYSIFSPIFKMAAKININSENSVLVREKNLIMLDISGLFSNKKIFK